jgi:hypothetical protein
MVAHLILSIPHAPQGGQNSLAAIGFDSVLELGKDIPALPGQEMDLPQDVYGLS